MDSKSHNSEELATVMINTVSALTKRLEKLEEQLKKNTDAATENTQKLVKLDETVTSANKIFNQVAEGVKDLYEKVRTLEIVTKLMSNIGSLGPLLGGLGGGGPKK